MTDTVHSLVYNWLISGADPKVGFRLFVEYGNALDSVKNLLSLNPEKHIQIIKATLCRIAEIKYIPTNDVVKNPSYTVETKRKFRDDYPFLADPTCPPELKIIVGDKITYFHNYCEAYDDLQKANNDRDHLKSVSYLVETFIKNRNITAELDYYAKHTQILGKHPIFEEYKRIKTFRKLSPRELVRLKSNLKNNIYRNQKKLREDHREDLRLQREENLRKQQIELAEIDRLLE